MSKELVGGSFCFCDLQSLENGRYCIGSVIQGRQVLEQETDTGSVGQKHSIMCSTVTGAGTVPDVVTGYALCR